MMNDDYAEYEATCKRIRGENATLLAEFEDWLKGAGLGATTVRRHRDNVDFYINEYLLYEEAGPAAEGVHRVGMFLGYWFIRKAMWASAGSIKGNAASLKKFYQFMLTKGKIDRADLDGLKQEIKEEMPEWLATVERYDDPDINDPAEVWGL